MTAAPPALPGWRIGAGRHALALDRSVVVGILNVTPDSFSDGGVHFDPAAAVAAAWRMKAEGAAMLDVGGESTRPGAASPSAAEELRRVVPVVERLADVGLPVSVDTRRAAVARAALAAGAAAVNDVSGLTHDPAMAEVVAEHGAGVVLMHMRGEPDTMDREAVYDDVVAEVARELAARRKAALAAGIAPGAIVLDPGFGFAKTTDHNLVLLGHLDRIVALGHPVLVGPSRKRFLGAVTRTAVNERDGASAAACVAARLGGAVLFRVHDVRGARVALDVADAVVSRKLEVGGRRTETGRPLTVIGSGGVVDAARTVDR